MLVAFWNSRGFQQSLGPGLHTALTAGDATIRTVRNRFPAGTFTERANFRSDLHGFLSANDFASSRVCCASDKADIAVHILWRSGQACGELRKKGILL